MIRFLKINGYKTLKDFSTQLEYLTVIFGPNAAGKSNILDAIQLLSRMATGKTLKTAFEPPYRGRPLESFSFPSKGIAELSTTSTVSFRISVDVELSENIVSFIDNEITGMRKGLDSTKENITTRKHIQERLLRYELEIEMLPTEGFLRVKNESVHALRFDMVPKVSRGAFLEKMGDRLSLRMEGQSHPVFHDIGMDHTVLSQPLYTPHYPHLAALKKEMEEWRFFYFEPRERMRAANATKEVLHIGLMGEELAAYLHTIKNKNPNRFIAIERALHSVVPTIQHIITEVNPRTGEVEVSVVENDITIPASLVSEGTLRILGLLSVSGGSDGPPLVCFEEPENGIHPRRINMIAEYLINAASKNCQLIITTHSPILPDYVGNSSLFVCRRKDRKTTLERFANTLGPIFRRSDIEDGLNKEEALPSEIILRGDLDA